MGCIFTKSDCCITYELNKIKVEPLDLIFFRGKECISSFISLSEKIVLGSGEWSHVGIIVNKKIITSLNVNELEKNNSNVNVDSNSEELYIWESTFSSDNLLSKDKTVDAETNRGQFGVQIRKLSDVLKNCVKNKIKVGIRKLLYNPFIEEPSRKSELLETLNKLHQEYYRRGYPLNIFHVCNALCKFKCNLFCMKKNKNKNQNRVFCSQFVCIVLKRLKLLPDFVESDFVVPQELATGNLILNFQQLYTDVINLVRPKVVEFINNEKM